MEASGEVQPSARVTNRLGLPRTGGGGPQDLGLSVLKAGQLQGNRDELTTLPLTLMSIPGGLGFSRFRCFLTLEGI